MLDLDKLPNNLEIFDSYVKARAVIDRYNPKQIMVSISGGSDSVIMLHLIHDISEDIENYVFFDTGLEYQATKDHLKFLEEKYNIKIKIAKANKPIPVCCRKYGQPFLNKQVSEYMMRLQKHDFKWEDKPFEVLYSKYPNCKMALQWWCNMRGEKSRFNISYNKWLKEFIIENPPDFSISNKCCYYAKKTVAAKFEKDNGIALTITGVRKSEGGVRASAYRNCFTQNNKNAPDEYRPLFWYKEATKREYEKHYKTINSECYTKYGLQRTGCAGCPFGRDFEYELKVIEEYEPKLFKAVNKIFGASYEYTRKYREFCKQKARKG